MIDLKDVSIDEIKSELISRNDKRLQVWIDPETDDVCVEIDSDIDIDDLGEIEDNDDEAAALAMIEKCRTCELLATLSKDKTKVMTALVSSVGENQLLRDRVESLTLELQDRNVAKFLNMNTEPKAI
jgi:hypothetical protein